MGKKSAEIITTLNKSRYFTKHEKNRLKSLPKHVPLQNFEGPTCPRVDGGWYSSDVVFMFLQLATRETWQLKTHVFQDTSIFLIPGVDDIQNGKHIYNPVLRLWLNQPI